MRRTLAVSLFVLATLTWSLAQNSGAAPSGAQQPPSASPQAPAASQTQTAPSAPSGAAAQNPSQPGAQPPLPNAPIMEGCLGGSDPAYTLTDKAGTTYKLNFPNTANVSVLASHVGESVKVMGDVQDAGKAGQSSINVGKIGRGTGTCPAGSSAKPQTPNAQPQTPKP